MTVVRAAVTGAVDQERLDPAPVASATNPKLVHGTESQGGKLMGSQDVRAQERGSVMHQQSAEPSKPVIPNVTCPRCNTYMRLAIMEPAAMSGTGQDTLVFECVCGFAFKRPVEFRRKASKAGEPVPPHSE